MREDEPLEQSGGNDVNVATGGGQTFQTVEDAVKNAQRQVEIPEDVKDDIAIYLYDEVERAKSDRAELEERLIEYTRLYEAKPEVETKSFPWEGASNLVVPVVPTAVEAVLSRLLDSIFGGKVIWEPSAKSAKWGDLVDPLGVWLNWVGRNVLNMRKVAKDWLLGTIKHGTGITKLTWERKLRRVVYAEGESEVEEIVVVHDGPRLRAIPLADFFVSADAITTKDIQNCTWVGYRSYYTWKDLKEGELSGEFIEVDRIKNFKRSFGEPYEDQAQEASGVTISEYQDYEIWEIWLSYDVKGDGIPSEIVVKFEPTSRVVLSAAYNYFRHQERPFHLIPYMPREDSLLGIGIPEMLKDIQDEISTIHNQRIDNGTLANTRAFLRRRSALVGQDEIYPGAFIDVDEMDDVAELRLGDVYPSQLQEELHSNSIGEKRTGVSDYTVGRESAAIGSRATATSTMALLREGNKRFRMTIQEVRNALSNIAHQVIMLYQQFAPESTVMYEMFSEKEARIVKQFLTLPNDLSRANVVVDTPAVSETENKEMKQQTMLTLLGVVQQFYQSLFQAVGIANDPNAPPMVKELANHAAKTGSKLFERVLEAFEFRDADSFAPDMEALLQLGGYVDQMNQMMGGMNGANGPGAGGPAGASGGQPPMGAGGQGGVPVGGGAPGQPQDGGGDISALL